MILLYTGICFVWCIEENKSNGMVCYESDIQCRYFYSVIPDMNLLIPLIFQAPEFYLKHGYTQVFELSEYPKTGKRHY